ncbi:DUF2809 domain-containing protein [Mucilaginibacter sabulilitoris]|uniref:DUF2809 domain-containing protein n=1 Tax=Mucilaginibacter sabulilitoris TaxID=1173583 RepID=A0ABZ0TXY1_9SPHI|nr:DUF2809 domain-containing protein [Mucilaginibacter sabulilitoris]WPU96679.1 DUF2809 domain-containing protein [Mucilaginibacter sabulilitoris]
MKFYNYFISALLLLLIEVCIGKYAHDNLIRPYGGDFLVVILIYCMVKSFWNAPVIKAAALVLLFAYAVEVSQYFHLVALLHLQHSATALMVLGSAFSWMDMFCYTLGIALVIIVEKIRLRYKTKCASIQVI